MARKKKINLIDEENQEVVNEVEETQPEDAVPANVETARSTLENYLKVPVKVDKEGEEHILVVESYGKVSVPFVYWKSVNIKVL